MSMLADVYRVKVSSIGSIRTERQSDASHLGRKESFLNGSSHASSVLPLAVWEPCSSRGTMMKIQLRRNKRVRVYEQMMEEALLLDQRRSKDVYVS
jgi:hypothetical protein